jgi:hypothetical protein
VRLNAASLATQSAMAVLVLGGCVSSSPLRSAAEIERYDDTQLAVAAAQDIASGLTLAHCKGGHEADIRDLRALVRDLKSIVGRFDDDGEAQALIEEQLVDTDCADKIWFPESKVHDHVRSAEHLIDELRRRNPGTQEA